MFYEINVSLHGKHYFATHDRSLRCREEPAIEMLVDFRKRFPTRDGFKCTMKLVFTRSEEIVVGKQS